jgi:hypothetical protein
MSRAASTRTCSRRPEIFGWGTNAAPEKIRRGFLLGGTRVSRVVSGVAPETLGKPDTDFSFIAWMSSRPDATRWDAALNPPEAGATNEFHRRA